MIKMEKKQAVEILYKVRDVFSQMGQIIYEGGELAIAENIDEKVLLKIEKDLTKAIEVLEK